MHSDENPTILQISGKISMKADPNRTSLVKAILNLKGLCQLESMRYEVMQITFNCQNSTVFNA